MTVERYYRQAAWERHQQATVDPQLRDHAGEVHKGRMVGAIGILSAAALVIALYALPRQVDAEIRCSERLQPSVDLDVENARSLAIFLPDGVHHVSLERIESERSSPGMWSYRLEGRPEACSGPSKLRVIVRTSS